jgi:hypothetical protein
MAPPSRPTKRSKVVVADTCNSGIISPVLVASSAAVVSPSQTQDYAPVNNNNNNDNNNNNSASPPVFLTTVINIKDVLFSLASSTTEEEQAIEAMCIISDL